MCLNGASSLDASKGTPANWLDGIAALIAGTLLIVGYLTPIACIAVLAGALGVALSILPANNTYTRPALIFALTILFGVFGLGPGAFSFDAKFFGRREIIIPSRDSAPGGGPE